MHPLDAHFRHHLSDLSGAVDASARPPSAPAGAGSRQTRPRSAGASSEPDHSQVRMGGGCSGRRLRVDTSTSWPGELQRQGRGFYTIGSAGHESNALVAMALRPTDPALLHYRSGAFYVARADQVPGSTPIRDVLQGLMALADEPIAGGRHKVFGHPDLAVIPQTSTIASHLPRSVGLALALHRAYRLGVHCPWPEDAVVVCSFGDASVNHSTAAGAINTALNAAHRALPAPILFLCEDNGWGISVPTAPGWVAAAYGSRPGLDYVLADGSDPVATRTSINRGRGPRTRHPPAGLPAPAHRPVPRPCRQRRGGGVPAGAGHRGGLRPRPAPGDRPGAGRRGRQPDEIVDPLRRDPRRGRCRGRAAAGRSAAARRGRGDGPDIAPAPGPRR